MYNKKKKMNAGGKIKKAVGVLSTIANPNGKLRLTYECAPLAFLIEQAGGRAISEHQRIMDISPNERIKDAMNQINASKRLKEAMSHKAEAGGWN